jgi:hypothetical protein
VEVPSYYGYLDSSGKLVIACRFDGAASFSEKRAAVLQDGKWGFIDPAGELAIPPQFDSADFFANGLARVGMLLNIDASRQGWDRAGKLAIPWNTRW